MAIEKATPFNQGDEEVYNMTPGSDSINDARVQKKSDETRLQSSTTPEKPQPNKAIKITKGILSLLSPHFAAVSKVYGVARVIGSKLTKAKIDKRDAARKYNPPKIN